MPQDRLLHTSRVKSFVAVGVKGIHAGRHVSARVSADYLSCLHAVSIHDIAHISVRTRLRKHDNGEQLDSDGEFPRALHTIPPSNRAATPESFVAEPHPTVTWK